MARSLSLRTAAAVAGLALIGLLVRADDRKAAPAQTFPPEQITFFEKDVRPILQQHCLKCHGGEKKVRGNLRLTAREHVLKGGDLGPAFSPERPDDSTLLKAINWRDGLEMPPKGKLPAKDIDTLTRWVKMGLPWSPGKAEAAKDEPRGGVVTEESKNYWCYRPVKRPDVPAVKDRAWVRNPIDAFVLAKLEAKADAGRPRRPRRPGPPRLLRPDRPAAQAGAGRCLRQRPGPRRLGGTD